MVQFTDTYDERLLDEVRAAFEDLLHEDVNSVDALEKWLYRESELLLEVRELVKWAIIWFRGHTNDVERKAQHDFVQTRLQPLIGDYQAQLDEAFHRNPVRHQLNVDRYERYATLKGSNLALFRQENLPLESREQELIAVYYTVIGRVTVPWERKQITLAKAEALARQADRTIRERAWRAERTAMLAVKPELDVILTDLVRVRHEIAVNAGFDNYRDYIFQKKHREYGRGDCKVFHESIRRHVVPLQNELCRNQQQRLGIATYRPWDDGTSDRPVPRFQHSGEVLAAAVRVLDRAAAPVAQLLRQLRNGGLLDLENRDHKAPGGFNTSFYTNGLSYIFMNLAPTHTALSGLIHEMGHAFHNHVANTERLILYRELPMEAAELASHTMELFCLDKFGEVYEDAADQHSIIRARLTNTVRLLTHVAVIDQFQHWLYEHPQHTIEDRDAEYRRIRLELSGSYIDWDGVELEMSADWLGILHIFNYPFYFIEYGIAELGAQQLWQAYRNDPDGTLERYKSALALGNSRPLMKIFETAGIRFDFSEGQVLNTMAFVREHLERSRSNS